MCFFHILWSLLIQSLLLFAAFKKHSEMSSSLNIGRDTSWPRNCHSVLVNTVGSLKSVSFVSDSIQGSRALL